LKSSTCFSENSHNFDGDDSGDGSENGDDVDDDEGGDGVDNCCGEGVGGDDGDNGDDCPAPIIIY
jgi:hypothetical protein